MKRKLVDRRRRPSCALVALLSALAGANSGRAAVLCVNPSGAPCHTTIQAAVTAAGPTDTINVAAGTYTELVTVPAGKNGLILNGANAGIHPCTGVRGPESILNHAQGGFFIQSDNVVVDGFTVQDATNGAFVGAGIYIGPATSGVRLVANVIQSNIVGVFAGGDDATIFANRIQSNNQPGSASGIGIYSDEFVAGGPLSRLRIEGSCFSGHTDTGILLSAATGSQSNVTIAGNTFTGDGRMLAAFNLVDSLIIGNISTGATWAASADIRLFEGVSGLQIRENTLAGGAGRAMRIDSQGLGPPNATNVTLSCNSIQGYAVAGLVVDTGGYTGSLNAESNWWGSATGPTHASNPGGTGLSIVDPDGVVDFLPFLTSNADADPVLPGFQCPCTPPPANMTAWWRAQGNANDSAPGGVADNGTFQGDATTAAGKVGQAFSLDGTGDYIEVLSSADVSFGTGDFTIDCWIQTTSRTAPTRNILSKNLGSTGYSLRLGSGTPNRFSVTLNDLNFNGAAGPDLSDGNFHHLAVSVDRDSPTGLNMYVDGLLVHNGDPTAGAGAATTDNIADLWIGRPHASAPSFLGLIDEVQLYKRALSQAEIQALVVAGGSGKCLCNGLTCPGDITVPVDPGSCAATVTFAATPNGSCGTVTCTPASGSSFPIGTTPVSCSSTAGATCAFNVTVQPAALSLTKVAAPSPTVLAGSTLTYTISYANAGPSAAANVTLTDALPAATRFVSLASAPGWSCTTPSAGATGTVTCTKASVGNGESGTFTLVVRVCSDTACGSPIDNTATIASACDTSPADNFQTASVTVQASADLSVTKTHTPQPAAAGGQVTFTIAVANLGPSDDPAVVVTDTLPAGWTVSSVTSAQGSCAGAGTGVASCSFALAGPVSCGTLPSAATITLVADIPLAATAAANVVTVDGSVCPSDPNGGNDLFSDVVAIAQVADVKVEKVDTPDPVGPGRPLEYSVRVTNLGPSNAAGVSLVDSLPSTVRFRSVRAPAGWACTAPYPGTPGGTVSCVAPPVLAPGLHTIGISVTAPPVCGRNATLVNLASVASQTPDPDSTNNTDLESTLVPFQPCFF